MLNTFDDLYEIGDPVANRPFRGSPHCTIEEAAAFSRAEGRPVTPITVGWAMGGAVPSDVIWTGLGLPLFVSSTFVDVLREARFTGWDTYDVIVIGKDGRVVPGFYGLAITGRCDSQDLSRSELMLRKYPGGWFPVFRGCYFNEDSWDGSDLFMERPDERDHRTVRRYITGRVRTALRRSRISNLRIQRLSELEVDAGAVEISLRYRLPQGYDARVASLYEQRRASNDSP